MADLVAALRGAIEAARAARAITRADFVLSTEGIAVFPHSDRPGHPQYLSSLSPAGMVTRPQDCDCGSSQVAMVAHYERCAARGRAT